MGLISNLAGTKDVPRTRTDRGPGRSLWQEIFGNTDKESGGRGGARPAPRPSNSYGRSFSSNASQVRLIQALRSAAPGNWTDDRYEQTVRHLKGIVYIGIHRKCLQLQRAEFEVYVKDKNERDGRRPVREDDPPMGEQQRAMNVRPYDLVNVLQKPNPKHSFGNLMYRIGQQKDLTGTGLLWMLPNELGVPMELYVIPTATAIPQPSINPEYPHGYYRIQPYYPYGPFSSYPTPNSSVGAPIPAEWMLRFQYRVRPARVNIDSGDDWAVEFFLVDRRGRGLGAVAKDSGADPKRGSGSYTICRQTTSPGRFKIRGKLSVYEDGDLVDEVWVEPARFRLR